MSDEKPEAGSATDAPPSSQDAADRVERASGQQQAAEAEATAHRRADDAERGAGDQTGADLRAIGSDDELTGGQPSER